MSVNKSVHADPQATSAACALKILQLLEKQLSKDSKATLAISGGTTPKLLFGELAKAKFDWSKLHLFWVDERGVPPTDSQSNYKLAKENLIDAARIPANNVHRIQAELAPDVAAKLYSDEITQFFGLAKGAIPHFDIIHRGMGPSALTRSLFPGEPKIDDHQNLVGAVYVEKFKQWRITLLPAVLEAARNTIMLVAGADKAEPLKQVLFGNYEPKKYPCQIGIRNGANVTWMLDEAADRLIKE
jgi:6-phosphogluconolactonase